MVRTILVLAGAIPVILAILIVTPLVTSPEIPRIAIITGIDPPKTSIGFTICLKIP